MKRHLGKIVSVGCGVLLMVSYMFLQREAAGSGVREWLRIASNAAMIPGSALTALGLLALIVGNGFFDGIRYSMISFFASIHKEQNKYATYYDYMTREKKRSGSHPLLITGLCFFLLALILALLFHQI